MSTADNVNKDRKSERYDCEICCLKSIHENDFQKHLESRKHRSNLRSQEKLKRQDGAQKFECFVCKTTFSDLEFYTIHVNGRTHRRNLKKAIQTKVDIGQDTDGPDGSGAKKTPKLSPHSLVTVSNKGHADYKLERKKYKCRNIATDAENYYKSYITSLAAYLTLKLAMDTNIQDFMIAVNDKKWCSYGDIVLKVMHKEKETQYAIKCKQASNTYKQIDSMNEAKVIMEREYAGILELRNSPDFDRTKFAIFTTCTTTSKFRKSVQLTSNILNKWRVSGVDEITIDGELSLQPLTKKNDIINVTRDFENIFSFHLVDIELNEKCCLPPVLFFTNQCIFPSMNRELLKRRFDNCPDITKEYTKYIEHWENGDLGGNYKLRKHDVILKIGHLLLDKYIAIPKMVNSKHDSYEIWNSLMDQVDLTVVDSEVYILSKISQPINNMIEEIFGVKIDTVSKTINLKEKIQAAEVSNSDPKNNRFSTKSVTVDLENEYLHEVFAENGPNQESNFGSKESTEEIHSNTSLRLTKTRNSILSFGAQTHVSETNTLEDLINDPDAKTIKAYLFEEIHTLDEDIHLSKAYNVLWKAGKVPLLLSSEAEEASKGFILDVILFMKQFGVHKKFLLKTAHPHNIRPQGNLKIFKCLDNVKQLVDLDNIFIRITSEFKLSLESIRSTDSFFLKWVSPSIFFDMALGKYSFRTNTFKKERESELKIILNDEHKTMIQHCLYGPDPNRKHRSSVSQNAGRLKGIEPTIF